MKLFSNVSIFLGFKSNNSEKDVINQCQVNGFNVIPKDEDDGSKFYYILRFKIPKYKN